MEKEAWRKKGTGHRQRLRDKFLARGIEAFNDDELLELLLSFGTPRIDCKDTARAALAHFNNSLAAVLDAPAEELIKIKGMGRKNIFALHFVQGTARRYLKQRVLGKQYIHSSREVGDYLIHLLRGREREVFIAVFLDGAHAVLATETVAEGTISVNTIYPRELIKQALKYNAAALIVAHNHPSGSLTPSAQDISLTRTLFLACSLMNLSLLDHLLVGAAQEVYSFADHGIMAEISGQCARLLNQPDLG